MIIAGMPRSGTTLLWQLCYGHPQIRVTYEFGNYDFIGDQLPLYMKRVAGRLLLINGRWQIYGPRRVPSSFSEGLFARAVNHIANANATTVHLRRLARRGTGPVTLSALAEEARKDDVEVCVVGDKMPRYIFKMHRFVQLPDLQRLVIYRDCRDVTSSYYRRVRTEWRRRGWVRHMDEVDKIARRWVLAIQAMQRHADHLFVIRYEDLVNDPRSELRRLAEWLDVEPAGFDATIVHDSSVGKYMQGLTSRELDDVLRVAGPSLERLKYPLD